MSMNVTGKLIAELSRLWYEREYRIAWAQVATMFGMERHLTDRLLRDQFWMNLEQLVSGIRDFLHSCSQDNISRFQGLMQYLCIDIVSSLSDKESERLKHKFPLVFSLAEHSPINQEFRRSESLEVLAAEISIAWTENWLSEDWQGLAQLYGLEIHVTDDLLRHQHFRDSFDLCDDVFSFLTSCISDNSESAKQLMGELSRIIKSAANAIEDSDSLVWYPNLRAFETSGATEGREAQSKELLDDWLIASDSSIIVETAESPDSVTSEELQVTELDEPTGLERLRSRFSELEEMANAQRRGQEFNDFINELIDHENLEGTGPYRPRGAEIDGWLVINDLAFQISNKWEANPIPSSAFSDLRDSLDRSGQGTWGIVWSISGYSDDAITNNERGGKNILLFDRADLLEILDGRITFKRLVISRVREAQKRGRFHRGT